MADFVSWLMSEPVPKINKKTGKPTKRLIRVPLFLDDDVWHTEAGRELMKYSKCEKDINGHPALKLYYELSDEAISKCKRHECRDFTDLSRFPEEIIDAIKNMKMVRMAKGDSNWLSQLDLLNDEHKNEILSEYNKYRNSGGSNRNPDNLKICQIDFCDGISSDKKKEVTSKLKRIEENGEGAFPRSINSNLCSDINSLMSWSDTREGSTYWNEVHSNVVINVMFKAIRKEPAKSDNEKLLIEQNKPYYWHNRIWDLFKHKKNRNPMWI